MKVTQLYNEDGEKIYPLINAKYIEGLSDTLNNLETKINGKVSQEDISDLKINNAFKSIVFLRSNEESIETPQGGSYDSPWPDDTNWSDGIPDGQATLWASTRIFYSDSSIESAWTTPKKMTDTAGVNVEFSEKLMPNIPSKKVVNESEEEWHQKNSDWTNSSNENTIWMATCTMSNGVWEDWQISKIKGEKGDAGTGVNIKGSLDSPDQLPEKPNDNSDSYIINGDLWVWDGSDSWENVGKIKGEKGDDGATPYFHIKYASKANITDSYIFTTTIEGNPIKLTPTEGDGDTPGSYIGILANYLKDDIIEGEVEYTDYTWTKWKGEDGWGYEYIYKLDNTTPNKPNSDNKDDYVPKDEGWEDNPQTPNETNKYCYVSVRQKVDGVWGEFSEPAVYSTYVVDGKPGENALVMNLLEDSITIPCYSDGTLISGNHFGAGEGQRFSSALEIHPKIYYGTTEIIEQVTLEIIEEQSSGLNYSLYPQNYIDIISFTENTRSGYITIKATYSDYGSVSRRLTINKAYQGKDGTNGANAEFEYYQIEPEVSQIIAKHNDTEITNINPSQLGFKLAKYTQNGKNIIDVFGSYRIYLTVHDINGNQIHGFATNSLVLSYSINTIPLNTSYLIMHLYSTETGIQTELDTERIPVLWEYDRVEVELPDWVTEWDGNAVEIEGNKLLTGKLYAGESPKSEGWTGVLIGNELAKVTGLPGSEDDEKTFSGILGLQEGKLTNVNNEKEVTFALDAETGNAYFKGEVHATSGTFEGELKAATGTFKGEITSSGTINEEPYTVVVGGQVLEEPNALYLQKENTMLESDGDNSYYLRVGGFIQENKKSYLQALSMGQGDITKGNDTEFTPRFTIGYDPITYTSYIDLLGEVTVDNQSLSSQVYINSQFILIQNKQFGGLNELYSEVQIDGSGIYIKKENGFQIYVNTSGIKITGLPTSDPNIPGMLYTNDDGILRISK